MEEGDGIRDSQCHAPIKEFERVHPPLAPESLVNPSSGHTEPFRQVPNGQTSRRGTFCDRPRQRFVLAALKGLFRTEGFSRGAGLLCHANRKSVQCVSPKCGQLGRSWGYFAGRQNMADAPPTKRFMVRFADGTELGPLDKKAVRQLAKGGRLRPEDHLAAEGTDRWVQAAMVPGLMQATHAEADEGPIPLADSDERGFRLQETTTAKRDEEVVPSPPVVGASGKRLVLVGLLLVFAVPVLFGLLLVVAIIAVPNAVELVLFVLASLAVPCVIAGIACLALGAIRWKRGNPLSAERLNSPALRFAAFAVVAVLLGGGALLAVLGGESESSAGSQSGTANVPDYSSSAKAAAEMYVQDNLKWVADFPFASAVTKNDGGNVWYVTGRVIASNAMGGKRELPYDATLERDGDHWIRKKLYIESVGTFVGTNPVAKTP